jgi:chromosome partitioning protein
MKKIIAVANQKGGVGKTTTSINFAAGLAREGHRVLLIDLDPQGHSTLNLGYDPYEQKNTIYDVLVNKRNIRDIIIQTNQDGLELVASNLRLDRGEQLLNTEMSRETRLYRAIRNLEYDFMVFDCRPTLGTLTINALHASNFILVPLDMAPFSLEGFADLLDTIENVKDIDINGQKKDIRLLLTKFDGTEKRINEWVLNQLEPYSNITLETKIRKNSDLKQAQSERTPIFDFAPRSRGAEDYLSLTKEFLNSCHHENH